MAIATADEFLAVLEKSRLLSAEQLAEARDTAANGNGELADARALAIALARKSIVTRWQAGQLLAGRSAFFLGKYKLIEMLGRGGMGSVFLGEHVMMNRRVALKVLAKQIGKEPGSLDRFLTEARAIAALDHPNIVHAYSVDTEGERYYIVMEFVDGADLQRLVEEEGPLDFQRAADYVRQAAEGLAHAHSQKIVHCDIKPSNLVVNDQGVVKILDMGLARLVGRDEPASDQDDSILGSVDYLAPEQAVASPDFDHRADIYALGCTLYFLLTGHPPFPEGTLPERIMKHQTQSPPAITKDRADAPEELVELCRRMMAKKPEDRCQTASEVAVALAEMHLAPAKSPRPAPLKRAEVLKDDDDLAPLPAEARKKAAPPRKRNGEADGEKGKPAKRQPAQKQAAATGIAALLATPKGKLIAAGVGGGLLLVVGLAIALPLMLAGTPPPKEKPQPQVAEKPVEPKPAEPPKKPSKFEEDDLTKVDPVAPKPGETPKPTEPNPAEPPKEGPKPEQPKPEQPPPEQPKPEQPKPEQPKPEQPKPEQPKPEQPKPEPPKQPDKPKEPPKPPAKPEPFKALAKMVDMPKLPKESAEGGPIGEAVGLGQLQLQGKPLEVKLIGGKEAGRRESGKVHVFDIEPEQPKDATSWLIHYEPQDSPPGNAERADVAKVWIEGNELKAQWLAAATKVKNPGLRSCGLKLTSSGINHFVQLGQPKRLDPLAVDLDRGVAQVRLPLENVADPASLRLQVTGLEGNFPKHQFQPSDTFAPPEKVVPRKKGEIEKDPAGIVLTEKDTPKVVLGVLFDGKSKPPRVEMTAYFQPEDNQPYVPFNSREAQMVLNNYQLQQQQADAMSSKGPNQQVKDKAKEESKRLKDLIVRLGALNRLYQMINKTGKVQFRVYAVVEDQKIELATTQLPEGADTAAKTPEGPTVTAEDLNLSGEGGPKRFFSDDEKPDDKKPPKKK